MVKKLKKPVIYNVKNISLVKIEANAIEELEAMEVNEPNKKTKKNVAINPGIPFMTAVVTGIQISKIAMHKNDTFSLVLKVTCLAMGYINIPNNNNPLF